MGRWRNLAVAGLVAGLAACASPPPAPPSEQATETPTGLGGLPPCESPPAASGDSVAGLTAPESTVVTKVEKADPLTTVFGYVPLTPVDFERAFARMSDVTVLLSENEIYEAELLVTNGTHRTFLKARAKCATGSDVLAVVAPEMAAEGLPVPQRATPTPAP